MTIVINDFFVLQSMAYVCYGGEEIEKDDFEILRTGDFVWEFCTNGNVPEGAVRCGQTADNEILYVGRCLYSGTQTPGKVQPSHNCLCNYIDPINLHLTRI
ncbi:hypothetical protein ACKWTF_009263 [Chironomus riparius]